MAKLDGFSMDGIEFNKLYAQSAGLAPTITAATPQATIVAVVEEIKRRRGLIQNAQAGESRVRVSACLAARVQELEALAGFLLAAKFEEE